MSKLKMHARTLLAAGSIGLGATVAMAQDGAETLSRLNPPTLPDAGAVGYSQITVVEAGTKLAYISGQVAWKASGEPAPASFEEQAAIVVDNANAALAAVGATAKDLVMVRVYVVGLSHERMGQIMPYILKLFDGAKPSLTGIGVDALAAPDLLLEIEMTVRVPS
jgi:enamine deaminase RidA (YjgF/YER057c/UK114 family)